MKWFLFLVILIFPLLFCFAPSYENGQVFWMKVGAKTVHAAFSILAHLGLMIAWWSVIARRSGFEFCCSLALSRKNHRVPDSRFLSFSWGSIFLQLSSCFPVRFLAVWVSFCESWRRRRCRWPRWWQTVWRWSVVVFWRREWCEAVVFLFWLCFWLPWYVSIFHRFLFSALSNEVVSRFWYRYPFLLIISMLFSCVWCLSSRWLVWWWRLLLYVVCSCCWGWWPCSSSRCCRGRPVSLLFYCKIQSVAHSRCLFDLYCVPL